METVDEKKLIKEQYILEEEDYCYVKSKRWMWVRRCIFSIFLLILMMQVTYVIHGRNIITLASTIVETEDQQNPRIVLLTGFPPTKDISGFTIGSGKASAATAFSPNPTTSAESSSSGKVNIEMANGGEGWWDRLFPNRHVHLTSVQIPIATKENRKTATIQGTLSICGSKKRSGYGLGRPQVPDLSNCLGTVSLQTENIEEGELFGVLEWVPDTAIVLKKSKLYWLVVQTQSEPFIWVYAQGGSNTYGTAHETENGWEFQLDDEPVPSAIIIVEDHV
ncbi:MAG: hypothetical protein EXX96DRAFT_149481 [Benjaminiella poitrasii]|nr:MAG: hypothetical protein EXX96DRAFT_149481 [Benjaminiella poitrasii]